MLRFITPAILIAIAIAIFFAVTDPMYQDIVSARANAASYNEALNNSKALENERDKLTAKYNTIDVSNLDKLQKLLPDNIDNIRLILEIGQIALPYSMTLKDVKYDTITPVATTGATSATPAVQGGGTTSNNPKDYGVWNLEFSTTGTYNNFINFLNDLESNLRIVDISSITFSSNSGATVINATPNSTSPLQQVYTYSFKIKTYWLKN